MFFFSGDNYEDLEKYKDRQTGKYVMNISLNLQDLILPVFQDYQYSVINKLLYRKVSIQLEHRFKWVISENEHVKKEEPSSTTTNAHMAPSSWKQKQTI